MIEISRALVRTFRAVLKKITMIGGRRDPPTVVVFCTDRTGLHIRSRNTQIVLEYSQPGSYSPDEIAMPAEALADFEARNDSPIRLGNEHGAIVASWMEKAVPKIKQYGVIDANRMPQMPPFPTHMERQSAELLNALRDASEAAGTDTVRYAVTCLQLRGRGGQIIGTDGKQLLVQSGFAFGWDDEVLVPASAVFGCRELHSQEPIALGRSDLFVTLTLGPWSVHLVIDKEGRFPRVDNLLPDARERATVLQLDPADSEFLLGNLNALPGAAEEHAAITVEGNGQVAVRARGEAQPTPTEIVLARSSVQGKKVSFAMDRAYLARALRLGFHRISVYAPERPIVCRDEKRHYIWQPLEKGAVLSASDDAIRLSSADGQAMQPPATAAVREPEVPTGSMYVTDDEPTVNAPAATEAPPQAVERVGIAAVVAEAEAIKDLLRQAYTRTHQLLSGIKRYRKQAQVVKSALGSLRQLQEVAE